MEGEIITWKSYYWNNQLTLGWLKRKKGDWWFWLWSGASRGSKLSFYCFFFGWVLGEMALTHKLAMEKKEILSHKNLVGWIYIIYGVGRCTPMRTLRSTFCFSSLFIIINWIHKWFRWKGKPTLIIFSFSTRPGPAPKKCF